MSHTANQMKPILLICGCRAHESYLHAAMHRFAHPAWTVVGLIGGAQEAAYNSANQILTVASPDTYEALPQKIHAALAWIRSTWPDAPGVFKTDDDILVRNLDDLAAAVQTHAAEPYWGLMVHRCHASYVPMARIKHRFTDKSFRPKHQSARYCFGHGYWLSAPALDVAVAAAADYATSYLEDVCTGFVMNRARWEPLSVPIPYKEMPRVPELLAFNREA
jgi:hypothetical protein